jgi:hypothetical protein
MNSCTKILTQEISHNTVIPTICPYENSAWICAPTAGTTWLFFFHDSLQIQKTNVDILGI